MAPGVLMIDGSVVSASEAQVALDDGLVRGDGVFEGMRIYGRRPRTPAGHLDRLQKSADGVALSIDRSRLEAELAEFCQATSSPDCAVRLMVTRGGQVIWREEPLPGFTQVSLLPAQHRVTPLLVGAKTLAYAANMQAQRQAKAAGCDDALFVRADDQAILEGPTSAFAWIDDDRLVFPPLDTGVLDSLTRRIAMDAVPSTTREATTAELASAQGAFLLSTVMEAVPVSEVKGLASFDPQAPVVTSVRDSIAAAIAEHVVDV